MRIVKRILGWLILIVLFLVPAYLALYYGGPMSLAVKYFIGTVIWGAIAWGAIRLIRMGKFIQILGWLVLFLISFMPGGVAYLYGGYPTMVGKIYLGVLAWVAIAWGVVTLVSGREQKV